MCASIACIAAVVGPIKAVPGINSASGRLVSISHCCRHRAVDCLFERFLLQYYFSILFLSCVYYSRRSRAYTAVAQCV